MATLFLFPIQSLLVLLLLVLSSRISGSSSSRYSTTDASVVDDNDTTTTTTTLELLSQAESYLKLGSTAFGQEGQTLHAIDMYTQGIDAYTEFQQQQEQQQDTAEHTTAAAATVRGQALITILSLHTNIATAYSSLGDDQNGDTLAIEHYKTALLLHQEQQITRENSEDSRKTEEEEVLLRAEINAITSQASFFYGMVLQEHAGNVAKHHNHEQQQQQLAQESIDAYQYATRLDPSHWAAYANLGAVLQDHFNNYDHALTAYNKAYTLVLTTTTAAEAGTGGEEEEMMTTATRTTITDPPEDPNSILSQLQHLIGLCLITDPTRKCAVPVSSVSAKDDDDDDDDDASTTTAATTEEVSCKEMAQYAFSIAVQFDPTNEAAKHMLATVTADATMKRASNEFVKDLFDNYAENFEHSLVDELGYDGYERLRRGFDRALYHDTTTAAEAATATRKFDLVLDAGCGTGLVGEQFRNISSYLIGIDLSEGILKEAVKLRPTLYDKTVVGDITQAFRDHINTISLIVAADSFIYFGDLIPLFESIQVGLKFVSSSPSSSFSDDDNGYIAFTLENVDAETESTLNESKPDWRWQLTASGRFAHRKEYVLTIGRQHGLELIHYESLDGFRHENGKDVHGHLFVMQKQRQSPKKNNDDDGDDNNDGSNIISNSDEL